MVDVLGQPAAGVGGPRLVVEYPISRLSALRREGRPECLAGARDDRPGRSVPSARPGRSSGDHPRGRRPAVRPAIAGGRGRRRGADRGDDDDDRPRAGDRDPGRPRRRRQADGRRVGQGHGQAAHAARLRPDFGARADGQGRVRIVPWPGDAFYAPRLPPRGPALPPSEGIPGVAQGGRPAVRRGEAQSGRRGPREAHRGAVRRSPWPAPASHTISGTETTRRISTRWTRSTP